MSVSTNSRIWVDTHGQARGTFQTQASLDALRANSHSPTAKAVELCPSGRFALSPFPVGTNLICLATRAHQYHVSRILKKMDVVGHCRPITRESVSALEITRITVAELKSISKGS